MMGAAVLVFAAAVAQAQTADEVMARVAANQDRGVEARSQFVYHQNVLVRMKRTNGKLAWEEMRDYQVLPEVSGTKRELISVQGKYMKQGREATYDAEQRKKMDMRIDGSVVSGLAESFASDKKGKDGVDDNLFPLTTKAQAKYSFRLDGEQEVNGSRLLRVVFDPKKKGEDNDCMGGEALIDPADSQPVEITTQFICKIPLLVKAALGTNLQHLGFKIAYKKFGEGVWFPVSYAGEFQFRVLFLYGRKVGIGLRNTDFHRTDVASKIEFEKP